MKKIKLSKLFLALLVSFVAGISGFSLVVVASNGTIGVNFGEPAPFNEAPNAMDGIMDIMENFNEIASIMSATNVTESAVVRVVSLLLESIDLANNLLENTHISTSGVGIPPDEWWVSQEAYDALSAAVLSAQALLNEFGPYVSQTINANATVQVVANGRILWYAFDVEPERKVYTALRNTISYNLNLYDSDFNLVGQSVRKNNEADVLSYMSGNGGTYYLSIEPNLPTVHVFSFRVYVIDNFDVYELNETKDSIDSQHTFTDEMNINARIDNRWDEDWYRLDVTTSGWRRIEINNDSLRLTELTVYDSEGKQLELRIPIPSIHARYISLPVGSYYIVMRGTSGVGLGTGQNYNLVITPITLITGLRDVTVSGTTRSFHLGPRLSLANVEEITGTVLIYGVPAPNARVNVIVRNDAWHNVGGSGAYIRRAVTTNSEGYFRIFVTNNTLYRMWSVSTGQYVTYYDTGRVEITDEAGVYTYYGRDVYLCF